MSYYETLGLARSAEPQVIEAAYKAMMRRYHPDVFDGLRHIAEKRSKELNEAYAVLRDDVARARYNRTLDAAAAAAAEAERPKSKPQPSHVEPEIIPEPWDWDNDFLGRRKVQPPKSKHIWLKVGAGLAGVVIIASMFDSFTQSKVEAAPPPEATPTDLATVTLPTPQTTAPATAPTTDGGNCKGLSCRVLTPFGWGGIEAGVSTDSAEHSSGMKLRDDGQYTDVGGSCLSYEVVGGPKNLAMLVEDGNITTVNVNYYPKLPVFKTDRGVKLGDPERAVRSAYRDLKQLPDIYSEPPDKKLFHYEPGKERGIKFSIVSGKVEAITVGTTSIEYVEGCL